jgi:hypothetical protein
MTDPVVDHERLGVDRLSIDDVGFAYGIAGKLVGANRYIAEKATEYEYRSAEYE